MHIHKRLVRNRALFKILEHAFPKISAMSFHFPSSSNQCVVNTARANAFVWMGARTLLFYNIKCSCSAIVHPCPAILQMADRVLLHVPHSYDFKVPMAW